MSVNWWLRCVFLFLAMVVLAACSGGETATPDLGGGVDESATTVVSTDMGGEAEVSAAAMQVPANAVAQDTEITIRVAPASDYPDLENPRSNVLVMEPEGLMLSMPASVSLEASVGDDAVSVVQYLAANGGRYWQPLETGVTITKAGATASVTQFAPLAIVANEIDVGGVGAIDGVLRWSDGSPAPGATIELRQDAESVAETMTDDQGSFAFSDLAAGSYTIYLFYECELEQAVEVTTGSTTTLDLVLCSFD